MAKLVERLPLDIYSVHCAFSKPDEEVWDISQPDAGKRANAIRNRICVIESAARLGARHVVFHPGVRNRGKDVLARSLEGLAQLVESARKNGVKIAVENLPPDHLGASLAEMTLALEDIDPRVAGFCLDTGHAMLGQSAPCEFVQALGERLIAIHWHTNNGKEDLHLFPGADQVTWEDFFVALDEVGYDSPITVEAVPPEGVPLQRAVREVQAAMKEKRTPRIA